MFVLFKVLGLFFYVAFCHYRQDTKMNVFSCSSVKCFLPPVETLMASDIYLPPLSFFLVFLSCKYLSSLSKTCIFDVKEYFCGAEMFQCQRPPRGLTQTFL